MHDFVIPILLFAAATIGLAVGLLVVSRIINPIRPSRVKSMPYESGMDPFHDTHRRFDVRFHLLAVAFLVFDVELLFLYPWAAAMRPSSFESAPTASVTTASAPLDVDKSAKTSPPVVPRGLDAAVAEGYASSRDMIFICAMTFIALLTLGYVYDWRKGVFRWR